MDGALGGASRSYTERLPGSEFPRFRDLGTLYTGVFICSFLSGFPGFRTVQAHSRCSVNVCCPSMSKGRAVRMKSSHLAQRTSSNCHHHHCLCPLSRWDEGQRKGENRTQRVRSWARKGHSEQPGLGVSSTPLPSLPPPGLTQPPVTCAARVPAPGPLPMQSPLPEMPSSPSHPSHSSPTFPMGSIIASSEKSS